MRDGTMSAARKTWRELRGKPVDLLELPSTPLTRGQLTKGSSPRAAHRAPDHAEGCFSLGMKQQKAEALAGAALVLRGNDQDNR